MRGICSREPFVGTPGLYLKPAQSFVRHRAFETLGMFITSNHKNIITDSSLTESLGLRRPLVPTSTGFELFEVIPSGIPFGRTLHKVFGHHNLPNLVPGHLLSGRRLGESFPPRTALRSRTNRAILSLSPS